MKMIIYENFKSRNIPRQKKEKEMMINGHGYDWFLWGLSRSTAHTPNLAYMPTFEVE